ncbi:MAG: hypothetical protein Kow0075_06900 [Salibacteraceae bacterium]
MKTASYIGCLIFTAISTVAVAQWPDLRIPIEGTYGSDFVIVNYVDWGPGTSILDNHCLTKTYDFHQGTDFVLKGFGQMDDGVNVLAADSGVVTFIHDGEYDRQKHSDPAKGLGNYIAISHPSGYFTYYGHLALNSIVVSPGDTVVAGQPIAKVGSSGNSTDPHLHFELWYDSLYYIDPFSGPCGNDSSSWINELAYDSSFFVWNHGLWNHTPTLDTLRETPEMYAHFDDSDSVITYWSLMHGLRNGDTLTTNWIWNDTLRYTFEYQLNRDWWYFYHWSFIQRPHSVSGQGVVYLERNHQRVDSLSFSFTGNLTGAYSKNSPQLLTTRYMSGSVRVYFDKTAAYQLIDLQGRVLQSDVADEVFIGRDALPSGLYLLKYNSGKHYGCEKIVITH